MQLLLQNPNGSLGNRLVTLWQLREATGTKIENDSIHMLSTHKDAVTNDFNDKTCEYLSVLPWFVFASHSVHRRHETVYQKIEWIFFCKRRQSWDRCNSGCVNNSVVLSSKRGRERETKVMPSAYSYSLLFSFSNNKSFTALWLSQFSSRHMYIYIYTPTAKNKKPREISTDTLKTVS